MKSARPVRHRRRRAAVPAACLVALLPLAGCSDDKKSDSASSTTAAGSATTARPVDTSFTGEGSEEFCQFIATFTEGQNVNPSASNAELEASLREALAAIDQAVSVAPGEIKNDVVAIADTFDQVVTALSSAEFDLERVDSTVLEALQSERIPRCRHPPAGVPLHRLPVARRGPTPGEQAHGGHRSHPPAVGPRERYPQEYGTCPDANDPPSVSDGGSFGESLRRVAQAQELIVVVVISRHRHRRRHRHLGRARPTGWRCSRMRPAGRSKNPPRNPPKAPSSAARMEQTIAETLIWAAGRRCGATGGHRRRCDACPRGGGRVRPVGHQDQQRPQEEHREEERQSPPKGGGPCSVDLESCVPRP